MSLNDDLRLNVKIVQSPREMKMAILQKLRQQPTNQRGISVMTCHSPSICPSSSPLSGENVPFTIHIQRFIKPQMIS